MPNALAEFNSESHFHEIDLAGFLRGRMGGRYGRVGSISFSTRCRCQRSHCLLLRLASLFLLVLDQSALSFRKTYFKSVSSIKTVRTTYMGFVAG